MCFFLNNMGYSIIFEIVFCNLKEHKNTLLPYIANFNVENIKILKIVVGYTTILRLCQITVIYIVSNIDVYSNCMHDYTS